MKPLWHLTWLWEEKTNAVLNLFSLGCMDFLIKEKKKMPGRQIKMTVLSQDWNVAEVKRMRDLFCSSSARCFTWGHDWWNVPSTGIKITKRCHTSKDTIYNPTSASGSARYRTQRGGTDSLSLRSNLSPMWIQTAGLDVDELGGKKKKKRSVYSTTEHGLPPLSRSSSREKAV